jgi:prevent-host-death family protein
MGEREQPATQTLNASEARRQWSDVLDRVGRHETRIVIEKSGVAVAAIVSTDDLDRLKRLDAQRSERFAILDKIRESFADVPDEEIEREVAKAVAKVRAERRGQPQAQTPTSQS